MNESLKILNGQSEVVNQRIDNTITKTKGQKDKQWTIEHYLGI